LVLTGGGGCREPSPNDWPLILIAASGRQPPLFKIRGSYCLTAVVWVELFLDTGETRSSRQNSQSLHSGSEGAVPSPSYFYFNIWNSRPKTVTIELCNREAEYSLAASTEYSRGLLKGDITAYMQCRKFCTHAHRSMLLVMSIPDDGETRRPRNVGVSFKLHERLLYYS
jgi:hypothetical protein